MTTMPTPAPPQPDLYQSENARKAFLYHPSQLSADELLWTGRPPQARLLGFGHLFSIPYWAILGSIFIWVGWRIYDDTNTGYLALSYFLGFLGICLWYSVTFRYLLRLRSFRARYYGLTATHFLVLEAKTLQAFAFNAMQDLKCSSETEHYGVLRFDHWEIVYDNGPKEDWAYHSFQGVPDVQKVYDHIVSVAPQAANKT